MDIARRSFVGGLVLSPLIAGACGGETARPKVLSAAPRNSSGRWRDFDEFLRQRAAAGEFSGTVLVAEGDRPLLLQGYGMADRTRRIANTPQTRFDIASMGKMFTSVAIARLVGQGRLSFRDAIGRYVPGFPPEIRDRVTIHHLLTHTSGMGDVLKHRPGEPEPPQTVAGLVELIAKEPLQFEPGSRFSYSNSGFIVLGAVIERLSGGTYADHVRKHVLEPAGMRDTAIRVYRPRDVPGMAHPYTLTDENGRRIRPRSRRRGPGSPTPSGPLRDEADRLVVANPSGGAYSTVTDMLRFSRALTGHRLLSPALTDTVVTGKVDSPRPGAPAEDKYAYGFGDRRVNGVRIVGHNGGSPGYEDQLDIYLDRGYTIVLMVNQDQVIDAARRRSEELMTR
jgi:CubicO group peptidase (beta-lactamase class C family)